jgi:2-polyprenyl-3-methyl-5-hydroxy-6-metoxy-1,4-benzoquinol methylase
MPPQPVSGGNSCELSRIRITLPAPVASLRILTPSDLKAAATLPDAVVAERWQEALSRDGVVSPPLVSLFDDWSEWSGLDHRAMLVAVQEAQERIDAQWRDASVSDAESAAAFYDQTDTLVPLLVWWHGTDLNPARCAVGAEAVIAAVGGSRALDFGAGIGSTALTLADGGAEVTLADVAAQPLDFAEWRMRRRNHPPAEALRLRERSLGNLADSSFDAVVAFDVFEHLPEPAASLEQLDRLLAPAGTISFNQAYVPPGDELQHYPQRGEVLLWLHDRGYRLAHVPGVCWIAQKAPMPRASQMRQGSSLRSRIAATGVFEGRRGRLSRRVGSHVIRNALR